MGRCLHDYILGNERIEIMRNKELINRVERFISELGVSYSAFARNIGISASAVYKWKNESLELSGKLLQRIDEYLNNYGF